VIRSLLAFISRNPWIFVPLAFLVLIGVWITFFVLASGVDTREIPVKKAAPSHQATP
jgi:hypothetical protein